MAAEQRLIDVNRVIDQMQKCIDESPYEKDSIASYTFGAIIECLKQEPTVDAVEVVHGEWIPSSQVPGAYRCNRCGKGAIIEHNFCSRCGAKMDGGCDNAK